MESFLELVESEPEEIQNIIKSEVIPTIISLKRAYQETKEYQPSGFFKCNSCKALVGSAKAVVKRTTNKQKLESLTIGLCKAFGLASTHVCEKVVPAQSDMVIEVLRRTPLSAEQLCGAFEICPSNEIQNFDAQVKLSNGSSGTKKNSIHSLKQNHKYFLHLSDIHVDLEYLPGSEADCDDPLCCRAPHTNAKKRPAGKWGDFKCDVPPILFESMLNNIVLMFPSLEFVIVSGDLPPHDVWKQTKPGAIHLEGFVSEKLKATFGDKIKVYPTIGNHESVPVNSFPFSSMELPQESNSWLYESLANQWSSWIPSESQATLKKYGYYSVKRLNDKLVIISLNTNFCYIFNFWIFLKPEEKDPEGMFYWLKEELNAAESASMAVYIVGHIAPGSKDCVGSWSSTFNQIVKRYSNIIRGMFYGHTHRDQFQLFYDNAVKQTNPYATAWISPSVTTFTNLNPGFRIVEVDEEWNVVDIHTFTADIEEANELDRPVWKREYSFLELYDLKDLSSQSLHNLVLRMEQNDNYYNLWWSLHYKMGNVPECSKECKKINICSLRSSQRRIACPGYSQSSIIDDMFSSGLECY